MSERAWYDVVGKFKDHAQNFKEHYVTLQGERGLVSRMDSAARADYEKLMKRGQVVGSTIKSVMSKVDAAFSWFRDKTGMSNDEILNTELRAKGLGEMGVLPLVPAAIIAGAITLITKWVFDAVAFEKRIAAQKALMSQGVPATEASRIVTQTVEAGTIGGATKSIAALGIIGLIGFGLWQSGALKKLLAKR
jgi:hypothetical protein